MPLMSKYLIHVSSYITNIIPSMLSIQFLFVLLIIVTKTKLIFGLIIAIFTYLFQRELIKAVCADCYGFLFSFFVFWIEKPSLFTAWLKWNFCGVSVLSFVDVIKPRMSIYHDIHYITIWTDGGDGDTMPHKQTVTKTVNFFSCLFAVFRNRFTIFCFYFTKAEFYLLLFSNQKAKKNLFP